MDPDSDAQRTVSGVQKPSEQGGVWGSYVQYVKDLEAEIERLRDECIRLNGELRRERLNNGAGRFRIG